MEDSEVNEFDVYMLSRIDIELLKKMALEQDDAEALVALGYCYENGMNGLQKDEAKAFELYQKAAEKGEPNGIYNMGVCLGFAVGTGRERDAKGWLENIRRAAEMGFAPAQNDLGWAYECAKERGFFEEKDDRKAFGWYLKSAMQAHQTGIKNVIRCYEEGIGTEINLVEAVKWKCELHDNE